ncbi:hypothetical protein C5167_030554 [Papaver somniferum]|nr:hypothetical protein C5167_030554 [Papaver somniferum]
MPLIPRGNDPKFNPEMVAFTMLDWPFIPNTTTIIEHHHHIHDKETESSTTLHVNNKEPNYIEWLDVQPMSSVMYIAFGSTVSIPWDQMKEILAGLHKSGVRYLLVLPGGSLNSDIHGEGDGDNDEGVRTSDQRLIVPWCDQLRVLFHSSVGGFWTHCGWNSTMESIYAGVPMLTFPKSFDQIPNRKLIVDDLKVGMKVMKDFGEKTLVRRDEIGKIVKRFMNINEEAEEYFNNEATEMRRRSSELKEICRTALAKGGSSDTNLTAFIKDILDIHAPISVKRCHIVVVPFPGRGLINPMMNFCKHLAHKLEDNIKITFVVTEEWLGILESTPMPSQIHLRPIPNVIPSEFVWSSKLDFDSFLEIVLAKMGSPFEHILNTSEPVTAIVTDFYLIWAISIGNQRNIPVILFWPSPAVVFTVMYHTDLLIKNGHSLANVSDCCDEVIDYVPRVSPTRLADMPLFPRVNGPCYPPMVAFSMLDKVHCLLIATFYEIEPLVTDTLKAILPFPTYTIGPSIPNITATNGHYQHGVVANDEISTNSPRLVVPWCDQLRVLCHSSVGGFWTHCGWNSVMETVYAGVPMITFPFYFDQIPNRKLIADDLEVGIKVTKEFGAKAVVKRDEVEKIVKNFMNTNEAEEDDVNEAKEMRRRSSELKDKCRRALAKGGSSDTNLDSFIKTSSKSMVMILLVPSFRIS